MRYVQASLVLVILFGLSYLFIATPERLRDGVRCKNCNVILISVDTLGHDHLSLYDQKLNTSPFLTSLAESSTVFDRAFSQAPWTLPSHTAMLTGLYPWDVNIWLPSDILPKTVLTLAEQLQAYGYTTAAFSNGAFVRPGWGLDQGFDEFYGSVQEDAWEDVPKIFTDATAWISKHDRSKPFFLLIRPFEVHDPYAEDGESVVIQDLAALNLGTTTEKEAVAERYRVLYRKEVAKTDAALKEFIGELSAVGLLKNTMIIVTSDHGEEFNEHGTVGFHAVTTYREVLHVPLLIKTPGTKRTRIERSVEVRSIPATIFDLIGMPPNYTLAPSLVPYMEGIDLGDQVVRSRTALKRDELLSNFANGYGASGLIPTLRQAAYTGPYLDSVLVDDTHVIRDMSGTVTVFDLATDFYEQKPVDTAQATSANIKKALELLDAP